MHDPSINFPTRSCSHSQRGRFSEQNIHTRKKISFTADSFGRKKKTCQHRDSSSSKTPNYLRIFPSTNLSLFLLFLRKSSGKPRSQNARAVNPGKAEQSASTLELGRILTNRGELQRRSETAIQPPRSRRRGSFVVFTHFRCGETGVCCASWLGNAALFLVWAGSV